MENTANSAAAVPALYDRYIQSVDAYYAKQKAGDILGAMFSGRGRYGGCPLHEPFLLELKQLIADFAKSDPSPAPAEELLYFMLLTEHVPQNHPAALILETAEGLVLPLLPCLSRETRETLFARYRLKLRKRSGLPCQREVLKELKRSL